jgi:molybdopterin/thiamine biosynthesis adenylyltransferase
MKHLRQIEINDWVQDNLTNKTALVAGNGAIGSSTAIILARTGIKKIIAIDPQMLEEHNLENQAYTFADIGQSKVSALERKVKEIDDSIEFVGIEKYLHEIPDSELVADAYLGCFDNFGGRFSLNARAIFKNIPLIDAGIEGLTGTIRTIIPGKTACFECQPAFIPNDMLKASCSEDPIPSTFITALQASVLQVTQMLKLFFNWDIEPYLYFDLRDATISKVRIARNPKCALCSGVCE